MASSPTPRDAHGRIMTAIGRLRPAPTPVDTAALAAVPLAEPNRLRDDIQTIVGDQTVRVVVTGTLERRLLGLQQLGGPARTFADLSGAPHCDRDWPAWAKAGIRFAEPDCWLSSAEVSDAACRRLTSPRVLLVAL